jgi:hypothetical protein
MGLDFGWGSALQGVGALASAWGNYTVGKKNNKLAQEKLQYEKDKDVQVSERQAQAQAELDGAMYNVYGSTKKKAKQEDGSLSSAYDSTTTTA